ncbi:MAG: YheT family hydrolase [Planctomyces sp.]
MGALRKRSLSGPIAIEAPRGPLSDPEHHPKLQIPIPEIPPFVPARGMANRHLQTIIGTFFQQKVKLVGTTQRKLRLEDDDFLILHDDRPSVWNPGDHVVLLLHGLTGCHQSGYMVRTGAKLFERGVRVFRMDHRGCGAGASLAKQPYHAGRTEDLDAAIRLIERLCPGSPISLAGYSISGNLVLKYLGDYADSVPFSLFRAVAVCPPVDLRHSVESLDQGHIRRQYNSYFTRLLLNTVTHGPLWRPDVPLAKALRMPKRLFEFDDLYTAPASGYDSALHYYEAASSLSVLSRIRVHTTILAAQDDPLVCPQPLLDARLPTNVRMYMTQYGGHLGFLARRGTDPDCRWMDWRVINWLLE